MDNELAISVKSLSFSYGQKIALNNFSCEVRKGEIFALLGPNGGGKTTLFKILATLLPLQKGSVNIFNFGLTDSPQEIRKFIGVVFQNPSIDLKLTVKENIIHHGRLFNITGKLFGIYYVKVNNPSVWHEDVMMYEVYDENTRYQLGQFYMDLYPRNDKYQHAAEFTIRSAQVNKKYSQLPIACIVTNFSEPTNIYPSLLTLEEVETLFHEFGHLLHDILSKTELATQSGTSVDIDFVEAMKWFDLASLHHKLIDDVFERTRNIRSSDLLCENKDICKYAYRVYRKASAIGNVNISDKGLNSDIHASAKYRAHVIKVMTKKAVSGC